MSEDVDRCAECGYVYDTPRADIAAALRSLPGRYAELLNAASDDELRAHSDPAVWSPLEYACHMRDVFRVQRERAELAQTADEPHFTSMRREERVAEERYNEQDPQAVQKEIAEAAEALASTLDGLDDDGWLRTGVYNYPTQAVRNVEWIGRHTIHEGVHHIGDIERLLATARG